MDTTSIFNQLEYSDDIAEQVTDFVIDAMQYTDDEKEVIEQAKEYIYNISDIEEDLEYTEEIIAEPNPGPQTFLVNCPFTDILYGGALGGGKSWGIFIRIIFMMNMYRRINEERKNHKRKKGGGTFLIVRKELGGLEDLISKSQEMFPYLGGVYTDKLWTFEDGFKVRFGFIDGKEKSFHKYQGKEYLGIYIDEAGQYTRQEFDNIRLLRGRLRNKYGFVSDFVMTANPGGPGHNLLKQEYGVTNKKEVIVTKCYKGEVLNELDPKFKLTEKEDKNIHYRVFIPARLEDNEYLANTDYRSELLRVGYSKAQIDNLIEGNWNVETSGMFDDLFNENIHILDAKDLIIPNTWHFTRGYDEGTSAPYASLIFAENTGKGSLIINGETVNTPIGTKIVVDEDYGGSYGEKHKTHVGDNSHHELQAKRLKELEDNIKGRYQLNNIFKGFADNTVFNGPSGNRVIDKFNAEGLDFLPAKKPPGSRSAGWSHIRMLLNNTVEKNDKPYLFLTNLCEHTIRTLLNVQRDTKNLNGDLEKYAEDHALDVLRYNTHKPEIKTQKTQPKRVRM